MQQEAQQLPGKLLIAPVLMSILGGEHAGLLSQKERRLAVNLARIQANSTQDEFTPFFKEVYKTFEEDLSTLDKSLPAGKEEREAVIKEKLKEVNAILGEMPHSQSRKLRQAFVKFARMTSKGKNTDLEHHFASVVEFFLEKKKTNKFLDFFQKAV